MANITTLPEHVGWYSEPDVRGTGSLIWTCISTTFICTWSALHLNVPKQGMSKWGLIQRKLRYMALAVIAPEYISMVAFWEWQHSRQITKTMRNHKASSQWNHTLSMFLVMGGIVVSDKSGGTMHFPPDYLPVAVESGWLEMQDLTLEAVEDKSKANYFTKGVAAIQILWFLSQLVGRLATNLPVTILELFTLAYVSCAIFSYALWFNKPFDVEIPISMHTTDSFTAASVKEIRDNTEYSADFIQGRMMGIGDSRPHNSWQGRYSFTLFCVIFGACHIVGWNAYFPTNVELLMWRIASICCIAVPLLFSISIRLFDIASDLFFAVTGLSYTVIRVFMLFEVFFALRRVEKGVYETMSWTQFFPHI